MTIYPPFMYSNTATLTLTCGFKWANTHNKCVHDSMQLANLSPDPCLMWLHYIWCQTKLGSKLLQSLRPPKRRQSRSPCKGGGGVLYNGKVCTFMGAKRNHTSGFLWCYPCPVFGFFTPPLPRFMADGEKGLVMADFDHDRFLCGGLGHNAVR